MLIAHPKAVSVEKIKLPLLNYLLTNCICLNYLSVTRKCWMGHAKRLEVEVGNFSSMNEYSCVQTPMIPWGRWPTGMNSPSQTIIINGKWGRSSTKSKVLPAKRWKGFLWKQPLIKCMSNRLVSFNAFLINRNNSFSSLLNHDCFTVMFHTFSLFAIEFDASYLLYFSDRCFLHILK